MKSWTILTLSLSQELDVVTARQRAKQIAMRLDFDAQDQTRVATAVSELARNAYMYAGGGKVQFLLDDEPGVQYLAVRVTDSGPGIEELDSVLSNQYSSKTGMGVGIVGARRLMDSFDAETAPGDGTTITVRKRRPEDHAPVGPERIRRIGEELAQLDPKSPFQELQQHNQELLQAMEALEANRQELLRLNQELEDTNRGVVALYAELDEKAKELHRVNQVKSRFLAHLSHEFRTPLNSVLALGRLLLDRVDGELTDEQAKQVNYIQRAANELLVLVNDLLDLEKVEAGTLTMEPARIDVEELLRTLRGMFMPLATNPYVELVFDRGRELPVLYLDEGKIMQIMRNLISNALKFTVQGEVHVSAHYDASSDEVEFVVRDTGIGIASGDQGHIFEEFRQIPNSQQRRTGGSGLGLAISRKLAEFLGGTLTVASAEGAGSTFRLRLPRRVANVEEIITRDGTDGALSDILVIDDNEIDRYVLGEHLGKAGYRVREASSGANGLELARRDPPGAICLDLRMPDMNGFEVLSRLRSDERTRRIPVLVVTSADLNEQEKGALAAAHAVVVQKDYRVGGTGPQLREALREAMMGEERRVGDRE